jgi:RNA recognition motif-containing protein
MTETDNLNQMIVDNNLEDSNIIVNYLPPDMMEGELKMLFDPYGKVEEVKIIRHKVTKDSMGYGFIKMSAKEEVEKAIDGLSGLKIRNKVLKVSFARKQSKESKHTNLYISSLPKTVTPAELELMFGTYGEIVEVKVLTDSKTHEKKGVGFVRFALKSDADNALRQMNGFQPTGSTVPIRVKIAEDHTGKKLNRRSSSGAGRFSPYGNNRQGPPQQPMPQQYGQQPYDQYGGVAAGIPQPPAGNQNLWCLFVFNLEKDADDNLLYNLFCPYGQVTNVKVVKDQNNVGKGYGFVNMQDYSQAQLAVQSLNGYRLGEKQLQVSFKQSKA